MALSIIPPYQTYILYEVYIVPGLLAMIQLFAGMQNSLSIVYDREMGSMRLLLVSPLPRWFLLTAKMFASTVISIIQAYAFLLIALAWGIDLPISGFITLLPSLILTGILFSSFGLLITSVVKRIENFAGVMNFIIFPMFFTSSALYPLWYLHENSPWLYYFASANIFTYATEFLRFSLYQQMDWQAFGIVCGCCLVFLVFSFIAYDPARNMLAKKSFD